MKTTRTLLVVAVVLLAPLAVSGLVAAQPAPPASYYGDVTVDDEPAPEGTTIEAEIDGEIVGSITTDETGQYGGEETFDDRLEAQCDEAAGSVIEFRLDSGEYADQQSECTPGEVVELDLTFPEIDDDPGDPGEDPPEDPPEEDPDNGDDGDAGNGDDGDAGNGDDGDDSAGSGGGGAGGGGGGGGVGGAPAGDDGADIDVIGVDDGATTYIDDVPTGEDVTVDFEDEVSDDGFTIGSIAVEHQITPDDYRIEVTEVGTSPASGTTALDDADAVGYLDVDPIGTNEIETVEFEFVVESDALPEDASVDTVAMYHYDDGWEPLETNHVETEGDTHEFVAETDDLSSFAIGATTPESVDPAVVAASLDDTEIPAGEAVSVDATVENDGDTEEHTTVSLTVDGDVQDDQTVTVPGGDRVDVSFTVDIDEPGEYAVSVDDTSAGELTVLEESNDEESSDEEASDEETPSDDPVVEEQSPGFGALVALVAMLAAALLARRR